MVRVLALPKVTNMYLPWLPYGMVSNHCYHLLLGPPFYAFHSWVLMRSPPFQMKPNNPPKYPRAVMLTTLAGGAIFHSRLVYSALFSKQCPFSPSFRSVTRNCALCRWCFVSVHLLMRTNYEHCRLWPCLTCQCFAFTVYNGYRQYFP